MNERRMYTVFTMSVKHLFSCIFATKHWNVLKFHNMKDTLTKLQMFNVSSIGHSAQIYPTVEFAPYSTQHIRGVRVGDPVAEGYKILTYSSINHIGWLLAAILIGEKLMNFIFFYLFTFNLVSGNYCIPNTNFIRKSNLLHQ